MQNNRSRERVDKIKTTQVFVEITILFDNFVDSGNRINGFIQKLTTRNMAIAKGAITDGIALRHRTLYHSQITINTGNRTWLVITLSRMR